MIDVDHNERERRAHAAQPFALRFQGLIETAPVREAGQAVRCRQREQRIAHLFELDVIAHAASDDGRVERFGHVIDGPNLETARLRIVCFKAGQKDDR